jgi:hypothetical protein
MPASQGINFDHGQARYLNLSEELWSREDVLLVEVADVTEAESILASGCGRVHHESA